MKRLAMVLIVLFTAATLFAGGKECEMKAHKAKKVALTGTLAQADGTDGSHPVFRASSGESYKVCDKTKSAVLKTASDGTVKITGKVVSCGDGEELMIESAKKM
jgi:uncharacterized protein YdeI (BOF family)